MGGAVGALAYCPWVVAGVWGVGGGGRAGGCFGPVTTIQYLNVYISRQKIANNRENS